MWPVVCCIVLLLSISPSVSVDFKVAKVDDTVVDSKALTIEGEYGRAINGKAFQQDVPLHDPFFAGLRIILDDPSGRVRGMRVVVELARTGGEPGAPVFARLQVIIMGDLVPREVLDPGRILLHQAGMEPCVETAERRTHAATSEIAFVP